jgi:hypothetical protein
MRAVTWPIALGNVGARVLKVPCYKVRIRGIPKKGVDVPISRATAEQMMTVINGCCAGLSDLLPALEAELSPDEFMRMKREIGRVMGTLDSSLSAKIAFDYPDLASVAVPIAHKL